MTAQELIDALSKLPPDTLVFVEADEYGERLIEPAEDLAETTVLKRTIEGEDTICYDYVDVANADKTKLVTGFLIRPNNLGYRYWNRFNEIRRETLKAGSYTNDDFDPAL